MSVTKFFEIASPNPDERRRGRLLNIVLLGLATLAILVIPVIFMLGSFSQTGFKAFAPTLWSAIIFLPVLGVLYWLNHKGYVFWASTVFLITTIAVLIFSDVEALPRGETMFYFVIPVSLASVLLRPYAGFFVAAIISLLSIFLAVQFNFEPDFFFGPFGLFAIAFVSWIATSNLENALRDLRQINLELDQRVEKRTRELAQANQQLERQAEELADANAQLRQLDELKSKFVSDVSHELRTPISNLAIYLEMLEERGPEKRGRYLAVLREETDRLKNLVSDVLDLSKMEMSTSEIEFARVDFNQIVDRVVTANQIQAQAKGIQLSFVPDSDLPSISLDVDQISQVLNNLVGNAINYTPEGGSVNISTKSLPALNQIVLEVEDTGMGISPKDIPHLFERFYRGQQTGQSTIPGTGLGLAITKEIIDMHDGHIDVKSEVGVGSNFTVYLPVHNSDEKKWNLPERENER